MSLSTWFVLARGPVGRGKAVVTPDPAVYRIVSGDTTVDIGNETDPRPFLRALLDGTMRDYLLTQGVGPQRQGWAERQAKRVQDLLASTDHFVLDSRTLYTAPPGKTLADALSNPKLGSYEVGEHDVRTGLSLPEALSEALKPPVSSMAGDAGTVSLGDDPLLAALRGEAGTHETVAPPVLEGTEPVGGTGVPGTEPEDPERDVHPPL